MAMANGAERGLQPRPPSKKTRAEQVLGRAGRVEGDKTVARALCLHGTEDLPKEVGRGFRRRSSAGAQLGNIKGIGPHPSSLTAQCPRQSCGGIGWAARGEAGFCTRPSPWTGTQASQAPRYAPLAGRSLCSALAGRLSTGLSGNRRVTCPHGQ